MLVNSGIMERVKLILLIMQLINLIDLFWEKYINEQVILFSRNILNIFHNFIPNKIISYDDRDPSCMNDRIKYLIKMKNLFFKNKKSQTKSIMPS